MFMLICIYVKYLKIICKVNIIMREARFFCDLCSKKTVDADGNVTHKFFSCYAQEDFIRHCQSKRHIKLKEATLEHHCKYCNNTFSKEGYELHKERNKKLWEMKDNGSAKQMSCNTFIFDNRRCSSMDEVIGLSDPKSGYLSNKIKSKKLKHQLIQERNKRVVDEKPVYTNKFFNFLDKKNHRASIIEHPSFWTWDACKFTNPQCERDILNEDIITPYQDQFENKFDIVAELDGGDVDGDVSLYLIIIDDDDVDQNTEILLTDFAYERLELKSFNEIVDELC